MSGRLTLATRGIQDRWLTESPSYSHFLTRFKRHTKFSFEKVEFPFEKFEQYENEMTCRIPSDAGDLIRGLTLNVDLRPPDVVPANLINVNITAGFILPQTYNAVYGNWYYYPFLPIYWSWGGYTPGQTIPGRVRIPPYSVPPPFWYQTIWYVVDDQGNLTPLYDYKVTQGNTYRFTSVPHPQSGSVVAQVIATQRSGVSVNSIAANQLDIYIHKTDYIDDQHFHLEGASLSDSNGNALYPGQFVVYPTKVDRIQQVRWDTSIPTKIIKYVDLLIGGQTIQRITGDYIYMYNQLHFIKDHLDNYQSVTTSHNSYPVYNVKYDAKLKRTVYKIHLPFYFFRHPSLSLPMCALKGQLVELKLKFQDYALDYAINYDVSNGEVSQPPSDQAISVDLGNVSVISDFVYISDVEKDFILTRPIEYVITQQQLAKIKLDPGVSKKSVMLNFDHPVKELFFIAKNDYDHTHAKIKHVVLKFNNNTVIDADNLELSVRQPFLHHTNGIDSSHEFGVFSFSIKPEAYYPTGQVNMSRIIHKLLDIEIENIDNVNTYTVEVYASNYNVLTFNGGLAGLKF